MPAANIKINGVAASNDDLPIATVVLLDNLGTGGELTYAWLILDQPPGPVDALSSAVIQNPTFTPKKEGTYLIKLTVNATLPSEVSNTKIVGIRQLKSRERVPAFGETTENGPRGWAAATESMLNAIEDDTHDMGLLVGVVATGAPNVNVGNVLRAVSTETIKLGLPGQEDICGWMTTNALALASVDQMLAVCLGAVDGSGGPYPPGKLLQIRIFGLYPGFVGVPAPGDPVYVSDTGTIVLAPGTATRVIGNVTRVGGGTYDVWLDGTYGATVALTAAPPADILKQAAAAGVAAAAARADHKHQVQTAAPVGTLDPSTANQEGAATSLARSDHKHSIAMTAQEVSAATASATVVTVFPAFIQLDPPGLVVALPAAGTYIIMFGCTFTNGANNQNNYFQLYAGAGPFVAGNPPTGVTAIPNTLRQDRVNANNIPTTAQICCRYVAAGPTNIYVGAAVAGNTMTVTEHTLTVMRIS